MKHFLQCIRLSGTLQNKCLKRKVLRERSAGKSGAALWESGCDNKGLVDTSWGKGLLLSGREWEKAEYIVDATWEYLLRWGYIELVINLLNQSIETTSGTSKAVATGNLAQIWHRLGDWKTALKLYNEVKNILELEKKGQKGNIAAILHNMGLIHQDQGNYQEAVKLYQQSLKIKEELGDKSGISSTLHQLGIYIIYREITKRL